MRYIPTNCLQEGMILAKSLHGTMGEFLLSENTPLTKLNIDKISQFGFQGVYVNDKISSDIDLQMAITDDLRNQLAIGINKYYISLSTINPSNQMNRDQIRQMLLIREMINKMIDEISSNKHLVINMFDLKTYDNYTCQHSINVAVMSLMVGIMLGFNKTDLYKLGMASFLHDIGKCFIDVDLINKPGKYTPEEYRIVQEHARLGYEFLLKYGPREEFDETICLAVLQHHERCDGAGYPDGIKKREITLYGRIISVCDVYDALVTDRPYRKGLLPSDAMEYVMANAGTQFDNFLCDIFVQKVATYPVGTLVEISNGVRGIVYDNVEGFTLRPVVKILTNEEGKKLSTPYLLDLKAKENLNKTVIKVVETFELSQAF